MKTIIVFIFSCMSVFAADSNDIKLVTWTYKIMPENSLATVEVFTRDGQTNLVRNTHVKDGVVLFRDHEFYYNGIEVGGYMYTREMGTNTMISSEPNTPYHMGFVFDASNQPRSAQIRATNFAMLDWFPCTNGVFYPADSSLIREANSRISKIVPAH
jgi:hypothetical protein